MGHHFLHCNQKQLKRYKRFTYKRDIHNTATQTLLALAKKKVKKYENVYINKAAGRRRIYFTALTTGLFKYLSAGHRSCASTLHGFAK